MEFLEKKCEMHDALRAIVSKQQKTISKLDEENRERNIIISGLKEKTIEDNNKTYETDEKKVDYLFQIIGAMTPQGYEAARIGKDNPNYNRHIKVDVRSKVIRDKIMNEAKKLKDVKAPWNAIYIKKDLHPAITLENNRLRFKMKKLKSLEETMVKP